MPNSRSKKAAVVSDWSDKSQVLKATSQEGLRLQFASSTCRDDRDIVLSAVEQNGLALEFASPALRNCREVVLAAVCRTGQALRFASPELTHDRDVIMEAVSNHGICLAMASEALQGDRAVVLKAVSQQGSALRYASAELRADKQVVMVAIAQVAVALRYARAEVVETHGFMQEAQPLLQQLYVFKATMMSGHSRMAVLRPYQTKREIIRLCSEWLTISLCPSGSDVLLGLVALPEEPMELIPSLAPGELYEVQIVLRAAGTVDET